MTLQECVNFLKDNKYLLISDKKYILSKSFQTDVSRLKSGLAIVPVKITLPDTGCELPVITSNSVSKSDLAPIFLTFIIHAQVPERLEGSRGDEYSANKYNEKAARIFHDAIMKRGINYEILVKSTMLYYKSGTRFKKTIGNYFIDGDWLSDYTTLVNVAQTGEKELKEHITKEIKTNDGYNRYTID